VSWDSTLPAFAFHLLVCLLLQVAPTAAAAMWSSSSLVSPAAPEQHGVDETSSAGPGLGRLRLILGKDVALEVRLPPPLGRVAVSPGRLVGDGAQELGVGRRAVATPAPHLHGVLGARHLLARHHHRDNSSHSAY